MSVFKWSSGWPLHIDKLKAIGSWLEKQVGHTKKRTIGRSLALKFRDHYSRKQPTVRVRLDALYSGIKGTGCHLECRQPNPSREEERDGQIKRGRG